MWPSFRHSKTIYWALALCQALSSVLGAEVVLASWNIVFDEGGAISEKNHPTRLWQMLLVPHSFRSALSLWYTQCDTEILYLRAFLWSGHRASWKFQGVNIPRSSPQLLINGNQKKISSFLTCWIGQLCGLFYSFPRKTCSQSLPSLPQITPLLSNQCFLVYSHSNLVSWSGAGTQPKTNTITNCDSCKEGERCSTNIPRKCCLKWQRRRRSYLVWIIRIQQSKQNPFWKF